MSDVDLQDAPTPTENAAPRDFRAQKVERLETAQWHAPRGPRTKIVAWTIILFLAVCVLTMIGAVVLSLFGH